MQVRYGASTSILRHDRMLPRRYTKDVMFCEDCGLTHITLLGRIIPDAVYSSAQGASCRRVSKSWGLVEEMKLIGNQETVLGSLVVTKSVILDADWHVDKYHL